jgi:PAS domain S-box-containing protein
MGEGVSRKPGEGYSVRRAATVNDAVEALEQVGRLAHVGYFTIESDTFSSTWSDELFRQFGFTRDAPPRTIDEFTERYHPKTETTPFAPSSPPSPLVRALKPTTAWSGPVARFRYLWTRATCEVGEGGARRLYGVTQDLTDLRSNEAALLGDLGAYRFLADNTRDLISRCRVDGEITYASPSCKAVTGYRPEELVGGTSYRFIHPDDRDRAFGEMRALFKDRANRDTTRLEYRFWHKEGRWIWLEANPRLVIDASGRVLECVDVARDITQRKLDAEALSAASARADAAAAAKTEFLANMSHELRTPLTSILGVLTPDRLRGWTVGNRRASPSAGARSRPDAAERRQRHPRLLAVGSRRGRHRRRTVRPGTLRSGHRRDRPPARRTEGPAARFRPGGGAALARRPRPVAADAAEPARQRREVHRRGRR